MMMTEWNTMSWCFRRRNIILRECSVSVIHHDCVRCVPLFDIERRNGTKIQLSMHPDSLIICSPQLEACFNRISRRDHSTSHRTWHSLKTIECWPLSITPHNVLSTAMMMETSIMNWMPAMRPMQATFVHTDYVQTDDACLALSLREYASETPALWW